MEWYRVLLILAGIFGIVVALINWYVNGEDIPNGLLTILSIIISGALGPDAIAKLRGKTGEGSVNPKTRSNEDEGEP